MFNQAAGEIDSEQIRAGESLSPFNRIGSSEEVADVAAFLRWVTGQNVQAGGGVV
jgi:NAD(P)-dependent dehydrogenase (short-subunit alcohol dehydrogenase family)